MLIYADFPVKIAPPSALIIINMTGMQTEQIFGVSIREDEVPFCVSLFFFFFFLGLIRLSLYFFIK